MWKYGYPAPPGGAWNIELDAARAGYPIDHTPQSGDIAAWPDNAAMGSGWSASPGGHVAYVESVNSDGTITISQMGVDDGGGHTDTLTYDPTTTYFIHHLPS